MLPDAQPQSARDRFLRLTPGRRILSVAAEMERAGHWLERNDPEERRRCYERALTLMDWTCVPLNKRRNALKEYRRWREELARLYAEDSPAPEDHRALTRALLWLHPESWNAFFPKQVSEQKAAG